MRARFLFILCLLFPAVFSAARVNSFAAIPEQERNALLDLFNTTGGAYWK